MAVPPRGRAALSKWLWTLRPLGLLICLLWLLSGYLGGGARSSGSATRARGRALAEGSSSHFYLTALQRCRAPTGQEILPALELVATWQGPRPVDKRHLTLVTQLNLERLDMLESQCRGWPHALAAAVYVPLLDGAVHSLDSPELNGIDLGSTQELLGRFHARMGEEGACNLQLTLHAEHCGDWSVAGLYPFNAMRNRALQMVETEVVFQLDVDFIPCQQFGQEVSSAEGWEALRRQLDSVAAVVLPAFEPNITLGGPSLAKQDQQQAEQEAQELEKGKRLAFQAVEEGKEWVAGQYVSSSLIQFAIVKFAAGHNSTQYARWLEADDYYNVEYANGYEPYTIMLRQHVPWFDERFRGYGFDKMTGYLVMWHWGVTFAAHPRCYVVHVPHPVTKTLALTKRLNNYVKLRQMFWDARDDLVKQQYFPVASFAERCTERPRRQLVKGVLRQT